MKTKKCIRCDVEFTSEDWEENEDLCTKCEELKDFIEDVISDYLHKHHSM